jgi:solute:Na+ symporter, SSS family
MASSLSVDAVTISAFIAFFVIFVILGFAGARWRKGNLNQLWDWALAGRRLGATLAFFLVGADLYTAYTFVAVPSSLFGKGAIYMFATPYVAITFGVALVFAPRLWSISREKGYVTGSDFVKDRFNSRLLSILVAITGIVALLPYIALQIVGMKAVLFTMLSAYVGSSTTVEEASLIIAFVILAAFTFTSGLRGATLTAVFKDLIIWISVIAVVIAVWISLNGNLGAAFADANNPAKYNTLATKFEPGYASLVLGSALALYLYPHAVNGVLSTETKHKLRISTSMLCLYGLGLALLAMFGVLIFANSSALNFVNAQGAGGGIYIVPALMIATLPNWLAGISLLGVFIGGLVPAAIMAIAQGNLLTRNIIKEGKHNLTEKGETSIAKWAAAGFKFLALGFVFVVNQTYAIALQLLGGVLILQLFPALFLGLYTKWFRKEALIVGLLGGLATGVYLTLAANNFSTLTTVLYTPLDYMYAAIPALAVNLVLAIVITLVLPKKVQVEATVRQS